ncbi:MAG: DUF2783 domain-containing protein [Comamonas sp.]
MSQLHLHPNIDQPDELYEQLLQAHEGLSTEDSLKLLFKLSLLLSNHIGNREVVAQALALSRP